MKILHIHESLIIDGLGELMCGLINKLSESNDVSLCIFYDETPENSLDYKVSSKVHRILLNSKKNMSLWNIFLNEFKICRLISLEPYDVVHIHRNFLFYIFPILLLHNRVKFFYTVHTDASKEHGRLGKLFLGIEKYCFRKKWIVPITISPSSQKSFAEVYGCDSFMIPNGIQPPEIIGGANLVDEYRSKGYNRIFVHVGRVSPVKNQIVLCNVFHRLSYDYKDVILFLVGDVHDKKLWTELKKHISGNIVYLGIRKDVLEFFAKADAMCLPSLYEGLPMTLLESLSVGCIPICSPVGGIVNVIEDGKNGVLSKSSSEDDFYDAMKRFLTIPQGDLEKMRIAAKNSFSKYDIHNTAQTYLNLYKKILNQK